MEHPYKTCYVSLMDTAEPLEDNVDLLEYEGRKIYLVGTAHISQKSVELAEGTIRRFNPDSVAVELCESRLQSLKNPERWKNTDIVSVIKEGKSYVLMAQLMLGSFQKKLGDQLKVKPGADMLNSVNIAEELGCEIVLADRDIRTTLKRTWGALGFWTMLKLLVTMTFASLGSKEVSEEEIERLKSGDALDELMKEFSVALPGVRKALIDERDQYLAAKIREAPGKTVVAVVGAGHVPGIKNHINKSIDLDALEELPKPKKTGKIIAWSIPAVLLGMIVFGFVRYGAGHSLQMLESWFWINSILAATGAALAGAHIITIIVAFFASPFTSLNPTIAVGWVAGLVEAMLRKPRVGDLETIMDDIASLKTFIQGMRKNRLLRILMIIILANLFGTLGTILGIGKVASSLGG